MPCKLIGIVVWGYCIDTDSGIAERQGWNGKTSRDQLFPWQHIHKANEDDNHVGIMEYDFVFACDLFAYIGDLRPMFNTVRKSLSRGGTFAFSAEIMNESLDESRGEDNDDAGFVMQSCARFAHKRSYIKSLVEEFGFETLLSTESAVLRQHDGKDVLGALIVLSLPSSQEGNSQTV